MLKTWRGCQETRRQKPSGSPAALAPVREHLKHLFVDAAEAAVGHDGDNIARTQLGREMRENLVCAGKTERGLARRSDLFNQLICVEHAPLFRRLLAVEDARDDDVIGRLKSARVIFLEDRQAR